VELADAHLRLAMVRGLGPVTIHRLIDGFDGDPRAIFACDMARLTAVDGVGGERARRLLDPRAAEAAEEERHRCRRAGVRIVTLDEDDYPKALRTLGDPPPALWMRGEIQERDRLAIAVVGPRRPSVYGHRQARLFAGGLARIGATVVSGLARGIDTVAHEAALATEGRTVAVLGSGFGHLYPAENRDLAERIVDGRGALVSEYPWDTRPSPGTFPRRNRLVAASALAVLVVEAGERSGALITARLGGELGRDVLVLPGPIDRPEHRGSNRLLRDGATLVTSLDDVFEEIQPLFTLSKAADGTPAPDPRTGSLSRREREVYQLLDDDPRSVDDLHRVSAIPASAITATLISLELRRLARRHPGGYVRAV